MNPIQIFNILLFKESERDIGEVRWFLWTMVSLRKDYRHWSVCIEVALSNKKLRILFAYRPPQNSNKALFFEAIANSPNKITKKYFCFSICVFFREHSQFTEQQSKGKAISLTCLYHFYLFHRYLYISQVIAGESSSLQIASSRTRTGDFWFPSASH